MSDKTHDFGRGPVPAHVHPLGGGWVADTAFVSENVFVGPDAKVYDDAYVGDGAAVHHKARVCDFAVLLGSVYVLDHAMVCGCSMARGPATIRGDDVICDTGLVGEGPITCCRKSEREYAIAHRRGMETRDNAGVTPQRKTDYTPAKETD